MKGNGAEVRHFADHIVAERGVRYGRPVMIPTEAGNEDRRISQGKRPPAPMESETWAEGDDHQSSPAMCFLRIRRTVHQIATAAIGTKAAVTMLGSIAIEPLSWAAFTR